MIGINKIETAHHGKRKSRTLPVAPNDKCRSRSLSKISDKRIAKEKVEVDYNKVTKVNKSLSQSLHTLTQQDINNSNKEDAEEIPVIVDEVTKWISGVNRSTMCQDIIKVILEKEKEKFQVS